MQSKNVVAVNVTEGEYGSVLEMLHYSVEDCRLEVMENENFNKMEHLMILINLCNRFCKNEEGDRRLSFGWSEVPCFLTYINWFLPTLVDKETFVELVSVKEKIKTSLANA